MGILFENCISNNGGEVTYEMELDQTFTPDPAASSLSPSVGSKRTVSSPRTLPLEADLGAINKLRLIDTIKCFSFLVTHVNVKQRLQINIKKQIPSLY